ncbi:MAG: glycosyltransferase [Alphaproteobacteria bacterium]|nr:glycosyltransferase [Alphaproteobacteria bacterium]
MDASPLISVIVPSYNYAAFLPACIESVAVQGYPELELVVIDDRSADNSVQVIEDLSSRDDLRSAFKGRVHLEVNANNLGAHETINRGIRASSGSYVCIVNADDVYGPDRLHKMMEQVRAKAARFAFSGVDFIDEHGLRSGNQPESVVHRLRRRQAAIDKFPTVGFACLVSNVAISTGNFLFERRLYDEVGPFGGLRYCHDWDFLLRCLLFTEPLYVPNATYKYRVHGTNTFRSLEHIAASESATVYRNYFNQIILNRHLNRKAPGPVSWPGVFDVFMSAFGLWPHWDGERAA